jgi:hypothetical protein
MYKFSSHLTLSLNCEVHLTICGEQTDVYYQKLYGQF